MKQFIGSVCDPEGLRRDAFFGVKQTNIKEHRSSLILFPKLLQEFKTGRSLITSSHIRNHKVVGTSIIVGILLILQRHIVTNHVVHNSSI